MMRCAPSTTLAGSTPSRVSMAGSRRSPFFKTTFFMAGSYSTAVPPATTSEAEAVLVSI